MYVVGSPNWLDLWELPPHQFRWVCYQKWSREKGWWSLGFANGVTVNSNWVILEEVGEGVVGGYVLEIFRLLRIWEFCFMWIWYLSFHYWLVSVLFRFQSSKLNTDRITLVQFDLAYSVCFWLVNLVLLEVYSPLFSFSSIFFALDLREKLKEENWKWSKN